MRDIREGFARLFDWFKRRSLDRELEEELRFHRHQLERDEVAGGADPPTAAYRARRRLGNVTRMRELMRERWSIPWLDQLQHDVRHAVRGLRRSPGFTATAVVTLALGIGANAAMFDVVDRLMFRPPPYLRDPDTVHRIYLQWWDHGSQLTTTSTQYARYLDLRNWTDSFSQFAAFYERALAVGDGASVRERRVGAVSADFFEFFDARPVLGRFFRRDEDVTPNGADVAVLSHAFWRDEFAGRDVRGEQLQVGDVRATLIGVAPPGFAGINDANPPDVYIPITTFAGSSDTDDARTYFTAYRWSWVQMLVRRKPDVSRESAEADATDALRRSWQAGLADDPRDRTLESARPRALVSSVRPGAGPTPGLEARTALWVTGVSAIVLLIACANVANLFLARALRRQRETALRLALGVSRRRLMMQTLTESFVLASLGGIAALLVAYWAGAAIRRLLITADPTVSMLNEGRTFAATSALTMMTALFVSCVPISLVGRHDVAQALRGGIHGGGADGARIRAALLVLQGALAVVLLVGAALFVQSLNAVKAVPMGYDVDRVVLVHRVIQGLAFQDSIQVPLRHRLLAAAEALPQVESAAWVSSAPFISTSNTDLFVPGIDSVNHLGVFTYQATTPDYFRTMGTRIVRGRGLTDDDRTGGPNVAVVSQSMAERLWPDREAIGECFSMRSETAPCLTVVGIAQDMVQRDLVNGQQYHYYVSIEQYTRTWGRGMVLRLRGDPAREAEEVRAALQREMSGGSYLTALPLREIVQGERRSWRLGATMFVAFGVLALIVAAVGFYGVVGYSVAQRMHELGIRVALGARQRDVVRLVVGQAVRLAILGVIVGIVVAFAAGPWIEPVLFHQSARDPLSYAIVALVIVVMALVASAGPALRAARADPNRVLRAD